MLSPTHLIRAFMTLEELSEYVIIAIDDPFRCAKANVDCRDSRMALGGWHGVLGDAHGYCLQAVPRIPKTFVLVPKAYAFFCIGSPEYG